MTKTHIPLTIIGGYLGAGKTTLINQLLQGLHGKRLAVIVNDFGSINIDAELIASTDGETLSLTNGCICCSMTDDLATTLIALSSRSLPPEHILIETSGVAEPGKIAAYASALPALQLQGIIVVVDGETIVARMKDKFVGELVIRQLEAADLIFVSKLDLLVSGLKGSALNAIATKSNAPTIQSGEKRRAWEILIDSTSEKSKSHGLRHGREHVHDSQFMQWSFTSDILLDRTAVLAMIESRPSSVYRMKGFVRFTEDAEYWQVLQVVGSRVRLDIGAVSNGSSPPSRIVAIGDREDEAAQLWAAMFADSLQGYQP